MSHSEWVSEVERGYAWVACFGGETLASRAIRRVLICRPVSVVCRVIVAAMEAMEGLNHG